MKAKPIAAGALATTCRLAILGVMVIALIQPLPAVENGTTRRTEPQASAAGPALVAESGGTSSATQLALDHGPALSLERPSLVAEQEPANGTSPVHQRFVLSSSSPRLELDRSLRAGPISGPEPMPAAEHPVLEPGAPDKEPRRR